VRDAWREWIGDGSAIGYNASLFEGNWSRVGIAISGGGLRAALYGAAVINALDARNESAKAAGTGGLLQVASYMSALSGERAYCSTGDESNAFQAGRGLQVQCY
jgi:lysophospholipase